MLLTTTCLILTYLISSISAAIIVSKLLGLPDPRTEGSKNPGATNVLRIGGKKAAALTFLGDGLKGFIPVLIAKLLGIEGFMLGLIAWVAILGHIFPLYYGFQGGKGVATMIGALLALSPLLGIAFLIIWIAMAKLFHYSSLSALTATVAMPVLALVLREQIMIPIILITLTILFTHRSNIERLLNGTEPKIK